MSRQRRPTLTQTQQPTRRFGMRTPDAQIQAEIEAGMIKYFAPYPPPTLAPPLHPIRFEAPPKIIVFVRGLQNRANTECHMQLKARHNGPAAPSESDTPPASPYHPQSEHSRLANDDHADHELVELNHSHISDFGAGPFQHSLPPPNATAYRPPALHRT
ncbi:hypothetical protein FIBSPDRAFT_946829 [Athelia psychrophila]|uniref:Uncharacterized protein n=1 Tax=Athelia psychrophila TaxID=1759441 RepID=A0A166SL60_9AGAM|nr:hypothetical protein FIBSPDRAFT_946829 [Fibularhizoctonia sp. CBS 109695]